MKTIKYIIPLYALLFAAGCSQKEPIDGTAPGTGGAIYLGIEGIAGKKDPGTRVAVDKWDSTTVSIAYAFGTPAHYDRALTVNIKDDQLFHVNTGMEYPSDNNIAASFVGYHPAKTPSNQGIVSFDLSAGDVDLMLSNELSGTWEIPITGTMKFEHKLTRVTFEMNCKHGSVYPETVHGVRASASTSAKLMTYASVNLNNRALDFSFPGQVTSSLPDGAEVPPSVDNPLVFDLMLQPGVPVSFEVITLTDVKTIGITGDDTLWEMLTETDGGKAGVQYTVKLSFSGVGIINRGITITPWVVGGTAYSEGTLW